ncbi:MAG: hypothetical protein COU10_03165 [Candidatus Harrisonbacteria bacterium CG10_big_fil_rev_8_21_14_0_10_45_28]|uniref:Type II secretion system protein GspF domain-containing protein n=1 Tax=Candidatus Harrisonbacteria bacterium CG10_big_fil_rev_8_21_14_0_10_45_28 TaxID=1974586 RepID=A0A2H0UMT8_9BACT|nr:MAG: hypothetical protein COU10_03165 [Candidatus Harrisonbacteria bacterium CG10_big_fil_rev_8_21_14_0_10_45_28]
MKFHYTATNNRGQIVEDNEDAQNTAELLALLASKDLRPVSVKQLKGSASFSKSRMLFGKKITIGDKIFLTKYLAIMLQVGIDLFQAINILLADFQKSTLRTLLAEVRDALEKGQPFYTTFEKYPQHFSPVFVNLVKAGEQSGSLDSVFEKLTETLSAEKALRSKIRGAMVYPLMLMAMSALIILFLVTFALPKLAAVFSGGGFDPPAFSKAVFAIGLFINSYLWIILGSSGLIVFLLFLFSRSLTGRRFFSNFIIHIPVIKKIVYHLAIQRFASTLSSLLKAGVPIVRAILVTSETVGYMPVKDALVRIANDGVSKGVSLGDSFRKETVFPFVVVNLVAISEKAGHLDEILETLAHFYEAEIDGSIKAAVSFIEPVLLVIIGAMVGTIALSIIVPVYQLVGQL